MVRPNIPTPTAQISDKPFDANCCHMRTAIKHPVPDRVKPAVICNFWHLGTLMLRAERRALASECPDVKNYKWWLNPVWHRMLYSCTHMATVGVKGLKCSAVHQLKHVREFINKRTIALFTILTHCLIQAHLVNSRNNEVCADNYLQFIYGLRTCSVA